MIKIFYKNGHNFAMLQKLIQWALTITVQQLTVLVYFSQYIYISL